MKLTGILILIIIGAAALIFIQPTIVSDWFSSQLVDGQEITVEGTLEFLAYPPLGQIVPPVLVWGLQEHFLRVDEPFLFFAGIESRFFYLARDGHPIASLDGFSTGDMVVVSGKVLILEDVNMNKVYLIEYDSISLKG